MRLCLLLTLTVLLVGCAGPAGEKPPAPPLSQLPRPSELAAVLPRTAAGLHSEVTRTLVTRGNQLLPFPGFARNVVGDEASRSATYSGRTDELTFALYALNASLVDETQTLEQIMLDYDWLTAEPTAPHGLWLGLPDHAADTWRWLEASTLRGVWYDLTDLGLRGINAAAANPTGLVAVVNFSDSDAQLNSIALRFKNAGTVAGDELLYYMSRDAADPPLTTSVSRTSMAGAAEIIHAAGGGEVFSAPFVLRYLGSDKIVYGHKAPGEPQEVLMSDLDGSNVLEALSAAEDQYPGGFSPDGRKGFFMRPDSVTGRFNLHGLDTETFDLGRVSRDIDSFGKAVWDLSIDDTGTVFSAIAAQQVDAASDRYSIVRVQGSPPFPVNATPVSLIIPLPDEDARDPEMVELAEMSGFPLYYVYFASRNRDDPSYNIYRVAYPSAGTVEPVLIDPTADLRFPAPSPDGRYLAYLRQAVGSSEPGQVMVTDLLKPEAGTLVADDCVAQIAWYDPTP
jgi:hypothetical protein